MKHAVLAAMLAFRKGDFTTRLPEGWTGVRGKIADAFLETRLRSSQHMIVGLGTGRAMRAADRWQLVQFEQELREQPLAAARMTSEGLAKYLDSLGSINQREDSMPTPPASPPPCSTRSAHAPAMPCRRSALSSTSTSVFIVGPFGGNAQGVRAKTVIACRVRQRRRGHPQ